VIRSAKQGAWVLVFCAVCLTTTAFAAQRTWYIMTTGNGHGFQLFDRKEHKITTFLEHPYRYVAPENDQRKQGVGRRNLAHDIYGGIRVDGASAWLSDQTTVEYEQQTHIIHGTSTHQAVRVDTYYFAPFGYPGNGMMMLFSATNTSSSAKNVSLFAKPNLKLGAAPGVDRLNPGHEGETIEWKSGASPAHAVETGPGGGHAIYIPLGGWDAVACGSDGALYKAVTAGTPIGTVSQCTNKANQVLVAQRDTVLNAGESLWWGMAILFVNDNPVHSVATDFKDDRTVADVLTQWETFAGERSPKELHDDALAEFEQWRTQSAPVGLTEAEKALWRQSETVLRLGQVHEAAQSNRDNHGMILASLPYGEWHTGWVRDAVYAIAALAMTGHVDEARKATEFFLGADGGFFAQSEYLGAPYRISVCRYFGNGEEEGDFNLDGPNIETDGWGLVLHAARMVLQYECDVTWLDKETGRGDTVFDALLQVAQDIEGHLINHLPEADASIWEVHWLRRQVFSYTVACQIRGLFDFADIADVHGRSDTATHYRTLAQTMLDTATDLLVTPDKSFASSLLVVGDNAYVDGSTVEFFTWHLVTPDDPIYAGTMQRYSRLQTAYGGYRRLEPNLSLTGQTSANEYDLSEWILLDLRIADAWRRMGKPNLADLLLDKVTADATANDNLIPELFEPKNGEYAGQIPMVGYGAGAWMMSQLEKAGTPTPFYGDGLAHCGASPPPPDSSGDVTTPDAGGPDASPPPPVTDEGPAAWDDGSALICASSTRNRRQGLVPMLLVLGVALLLFGALRKRGHNA